MEKVSRRTLAKGAAWAVPPVVFAAPAPVSAASPASPTLGTPTWKRNGANLTLTVTVNNPGGCTIGLPTAVGGVTNKGVSVTWTLSNTTSPYAFSASADPKSGSVLVTFTVTCGGVTKAPLTTTYAI